MRHSRKCRIICSFTIYCPILLSGPQFYSTRKENRFIRYVFGCLYMHMSDGSYWQVNAQWLLNDFSSDYVLRQDVLLLSRYYVIIFRQFFHYLTDFSNLKIKICYFRRILWFFLSFLEENVWVLLKNVAKTFVKTYCIQIFKKSWWKRMRKRTNNTPNYNVRTICQIITYAWYVKLKR